jgi:hypothetical protein
MILKGDKRFVAGIVTICLLDQEHIKKIGRFFIFFFINICKVRRILSLLGGKLRQIEKSGPKSFNEK